ncbi:hypothetical protein [Microcoleus sp. FACHB-672]|nr:hypothetical protein [Microcoleus sp. FACHB-672]MBD2042983.1 hypothetical protein [Microcoleus sp. FACHB-672]
MRIEGKGKGTRHLAGATNLQKDWGSGSILLPQITVWRDTGTLPAPLD